MFAHAAWGSSGGSGIPATSVTNPSCLTWTSSYLSTLSFADIDGDGDRDLFSGDYSYSGTGILLYESISTP